MITGEPHGRSPCECWPEPHISWRTSLVFPPQKSLPKWFPPHTLLLPPRAFSQATPSYHDPLVSAFHCI